MSKRTNDGEIAEEEEHKKKAKKGSAFPAAKLHVHDTNKHPKAIILLAGSFSPITLMHLRLMEQAKEGLIDKGYDVIGGFISSVGDSYNKKVCSFFQFLKYFF